MGSGPRAARTGVGPGAVTALLEPSTPKLDGANVSRAGSRVIDAAVTAAVGDAGGITTPGDGAVPVPARGALPGETVGTGAGVAIAAGALGLGACPRSGGGGAPIALLLEA